MMAIPDHPEALLAALAWQIELGADEAIGDAPVDRYAADAAREVARAASSPPATSPAPPRVAREPAKTANAADVDTAEAVREAAAIAAACATLDELREAVAAFDGCALKRGAKNCVFADGDPIAQTMFIGEAPGRDEDVAGRPFVGRSGRLLDRMLAAIGLDRTSDDPRTAAYISNIIPWRPLQNRTPAPDETAMMAPFIHRHIMLAQPRVLVFLGGVAAKTMLETDTGILKLRGQWRNWRNDDTALPALPMLHPAYLLRTPAAKRLAWRDLRALRGKLDEIQR